MFLNLISPVLFAVDSRLTFFNLLLYRKASNPSKLLFDQKY